MAASGTQCLKWQWQLGRADWGIWKWAIRTLKEAAVSAEGGKQSLVQRLVPDEGGRGRTLPCLILSIASPLLPQVCPKWVNMAPVAAAAPPGTQMPDHFPHVSSTRSMEGGVREGAGLKKRIPASAWNTGVVSAGAALFSTACSPAPPMLAKLAGGAARRAARMLRQTRGIHCLEKPKLASSHRG